MKIKVMVVIKLVVKVCLNIWFVLVMFVSFIVLIIIIEKVIVVMVFIVK